MASLAEHVRTPESTSRAHAASPHPNQDLGLVPPRGLVPTDPASGVQGTTYLPALSADIETAQGLARWSPRGPTTGPVVERLRSHISQDLRDAEKYVASLPCSRRRDVADETVRYASQVLVRKECRSPEARLLIHAKLADHVHRYAQAHRASLPEQAAERVR